MIWTIDQLALFIDPYLSLPSNSLQYGFGHMPLYSVGSFWALMWNWAQLLHIDKYYLTCHNHPFLYRDIHPYMGNFKMHVSS